MREVDIAPALRYELATCQDRLRLRLQWLPELVGSGDETSNQVHFGSDDAAKNTPTLSVTYRLGGVAQDQENTGGK